MAGYNADQCFKASLISMSNHFSVAGISDCVGSAYQYQMKRDEVIGTIQRQGQDMHTFDDVILALKP